MCGRYSTKKSLTSFVLIVSISVCSNSKIDIEYERTNNKRYTNHKLFANKPKYVTFRAAPVLRVNMDSQVDRRHIDENHSNERNVQSFESSEMEGHNQFGKTFSRFSVNKSEPSNIVNARATSYNSEAARRIVGGLETQIRLYPYNVAIAKNGKHWCGGSLIDEQWVVTAGHCLDGAFVLGTHIYLVRAGSSYHDRDGHTAKINKVFLPENYVSGSADDDMSLARLDRPLPIGRNIAVVNLPAKGYKIRVGDVLIVSGWGSTNEYGAGHIAERLRFVPVPVISHSACQKSYSFSISSGMICAGYAAGGMDACNHDSGGPAVKDGVLLGIVSFGGKKCGDPKSPGVYTRVSDLTEWVEKTITENEASTVPELLPNIERSRKVDRETKEKSLKVAEKKEQIKIWLKKTMKSPVFIKVAENKLYQVV